MYLSFHLEIETTFVTQKLKFSLESIFLGLILDAFLCGVCACVGYSKWFMLQQAQIKRGCERALCEIQIWSAVTARLRTGRGNFRDSPHKAAPAADQHWPFLPLSCSVTHNNFAQCTFSAFVCLQRRVINFTSAVATQIFLFWCCALPSFGYECNKRLLLCLRKVLCLCPN